MATDSNKAKKLQLLARVLGVVTGVLAWTAAAIRYSQDGTLQVSLIAAGLFFALFGFMIKPSPPKGNG